MEHRRDNRQYNGTSKLNYNLFSDRDQFEWLFGYFNYHTEHHLFPGLNPSLYPKIQPIVKSVCEKYGVRYKHISYLEMVCSQVRAWRKYSMAEIVLMTPEMNAKVPG